MIFHLTLPQVGSKIMSQSPEKATMAHNHTEHVQEEITHHASHGPDGHDHHAKWITASATTAAIVAAFAAGAGALATKHETESTIIRIKANDDWNYYQAKSIKSSLLEAKIYSATLNKVEPRKVDVEKRAEYSRQMPEIQVRARDLEKLSRAHLETHEAFEGAATLFHIAIAIVAIAVVAKRKAFWYISMVVGLVGILVFSKALIWSPPALKEEETQATEGGAKPEGHETTAAESSTAMHAQKSASPAAE